MTGSIRHGNTSCGQARCRGCREFPHAPDQWINRRILLLRGNEAASPGLCLSSRPNDSQWQGIQIDAQVLRDPAPGDLTEKIAADASAISSASPAA